MARIRTVKPAFFASEDVSALTFRARLTWIGLWTHSDDAGRCKDNTKLIKAAVWPLDEVSLKDIEIDLNTLADRGAILRYEVEGKQYIQIVNWRKHQRIDKPSPSHLPPFPERSGRTPGITREGDATAPVGNGKEGKGKEKDSSSTAAPRDDIERLCKHLADMIEKNGSKRPEVTNGWRTSARLLLDLDERTEAQVMRAIDWCQQDDFWHRTVLSMPTLRKQYDRLRLAAQKPAERGQQPAPLRPYNDRLGQKQADLDARLAAENEAARAELGDIEIGRAV